MQLTIRRARRKHVGQVCGPVIFPAMPRAHRTPPPLISQDVDAVSLFSEVADAFDGVFEPLQIVAASDERALFVARDHVLRRRVALRVHLKPDAESRLWFDRETQLLAALDHPVIRPVYSAGSRGDWKYHAAKWIEGESMDSGITRGPRSLPDILQLARDLAGVLEYVHSQRIVIRRIIPSTVMIQLTRRAVLTDLRYTNVNVDVAPAAADSDSVLPFLAPEIREGGAGEPYSDIYAVGALLYFATTGQEPPVDPNEIQSPKRLRRACPHALERIICRALEGDPKKRYHTAIEMLEDLMSDLGEYDISLAVVPQRYATDDPEGWEKFLRRALGDDYELLDELGAGGFGRVYRVRDLALEREVALKVLHPYLMIDPDVVERFQREARTAAMLSHIHIVNTFDIGGRAGLQWYTMEYVRGRSLDRIVAQEGALPLDKVMRILFEALDGLALAHSKNFVHRDLKPENLLVEDDSGAVRIADFGLALALGGADRRSGSHTRIGRSGTPAYAAPEQLLGEPVDHRADLYSLTLSAFYALTGEVPFGSGGVESIIARQVAGFLPRVGDYRSDVPVRILRVLEKGAARHPDQRFDSAREFAAALAESTDSSAGFLGRLLGGDRKER